MIDSHVFVREEDQSLMIGDDIRVTVKSVGGNGDSVTIDILAQDRSRRVKLIKGVPCELPQDITIYLVDVIRGSARLEVKAPSHLGVQRHEVYESALRHDPDFSLSADPRPTATAILKDANELARAFHKTFGYAAEEGYRFDKATTIRGKRSWNLAVIAYEHLMGTDLDEVLLEYEEG